MEQVGAEDGRGITVEASGCGLRGDFVPSWPFSLIELNLNFSEHFAIFTVCFARKMSAGSLNKIQSLDVCLFV